MVFFCWACTAPVATASAAAVANSDTMSFFIDPFMYTSLGHPGSGVSQRLCAIFYLRREQMPQGKPAGSGCTCPFFKSK
jgi:hypothetical protein